MTAEPRSMPTWEETSEAITMFLMAFEPPPITVLADHWSDVEFLVVDKTGMAEIARGLRKHFKEQFAARVEAENGFLRQYLGPAAMILHDLEQEGISVTFTTEELNRWLEEE